MSYRTNLFKFINFLYRYLSKETIVREHVQHTADVVKNSNLQFLELTICPGYRYAYKDDVLKSYGMEKWRLRRGGLYAPQNYSEGMDLRKVFNSVTYEIEELLLYIKIYTLDREKSQITIDFQGLNTTRHLKIVTKYKYTYGKCYSIQPRDHVVQLAIVKVDILARYGIYVYFGYPGQFMYNTKSKVLTLTEL